MDEAVVDEAGDAQIIEEIRENLSKIADYTVS